MKLKIRRSLVEKNELENRAARHRKKQKGMSPFSYLNPDAGDVEKGIECFNHAVGAGEAANAGVAMGEGYSATEDEVEVPYTLEYFVDDNGLPIRKEEIQPFAGDLVTAAEKRIVRRFPGVEVDLSGVDRWTGKNRFESKGWLIIPSELYTPATIRYINKIFTQQYIYLSDEEQTLYIEDAYEDES